MNMFSCGEICYVIEKREMASPKMQIIAFSNLMHLFIGAFSVRHSMLTRLKKICQNVFTNNIQGLRFQ